MQYKYHNIGFINFMNLIIFLNHLHKNYVKIMFIIFEGDKYDTNYEFYKKRGYSNI